MKKWTMITAVVLLMTGLAGCNLETGDEQQTETPDTPAATSGNTPDAGPTPTSAGGPAATQTLNSSPPPATRPPSSGNGFIYLVALEDNGASGPPIGCGDSLIEVQRGALPAGTTEQQITHVLTDLFSLKDQTYGESGLYNALYQSNLTVQNVTLDANGHATVNLSGSYRLGGACDAPRFLAQIEQTVLQFPAVSGATILLGGTPLEDMLSGQ